MTTKNISRKTRQIKLCSVEGCNKKHDAKTFCGTHLTRFKKHGNPNICRHWSMNTTLEDRFWSKIRITADTEKCWESARPYSRFYYKAANVLYHRMAWFLTYGSFPQKFLLHNCDNPKCVNPNHLREGTQQDNMDDKVKRNRQSKGSRHGMSKLIESEVVNIKELLLKGTKQKIIAEMFNVDNTLISCIKRGKAWAHI